MRCNRLSCQAAGVWHLLEVTEWGWVLFFLRPVSILAGQVCVALAQRFPWYEIPFWYCFLPGFFLLRAWDFPSFFLGVFWQNHWMQANEASLCQPFFWFLCSASSAADPLSLFFQGGHLDNLANLLADQLQTIYLRWDPHWGSWFLRFAVGQGSTDSWNALYQELGLLHVLVVSGSHFSFLGRIVQILGEGPGRVLYSLRLLSFRLWLGWMTLARMLLSLLLTLLALIVGFNPPCQRAFLALVWSLWWPLIGGPISDRQMDRWIFCLQAFCFPLSFLSLSNALSWSAFSLIRSWKSWPKVWQRWILPGIEIPLIAVNLCYFGVFSPFGILLGPILQPIWNLILGWGLLLLLWPESFLGSWFRSFLEHLHTLLGAVHHAQQNGGGPVNWEGKSFWGPMLQTLLWGAASWSFLRLWWPVLDPEETC